MSRTKNWVLTDTFADVWHDTFKIDQHGFPQTFAAPWSIEKRTLRGGRRDGVDMVTVNNGALSFSVLPTRGMGIWQGWYRGSRLGWLAPVHGPVHPSYVHAQDRNGLGWLDGFDEWICRCGLTSNGPPGADPMRGEQVTLHGRIANLPAHHVEAQLSLEAPHELKIIGQVDETTTFFTRLRLTTTLTTTVNSNVLVIDDVIQNLSTRPAELQLLYHCNFGPPFLEAGSRIEAPIRRVAPRDKRAGEGMSDLSVCTGPTPGFAEQVYFYQLLANADDWTLALLRNRQGDRGVAVRMNQRDLPWFTVWKNTAAAEDGYVVGLEPATNLPNLKSFERGAGRVVTLPPNGEYRATVLIEVQDTPAGVQAIQAEIADLQSSAAPSLHKSPQPEFSP